MHHTERSEWLLFPLQRGDEVAVVATSSALDNTDNLLRGISILDSWGLRIRPDVISQGAGAIWPDGMTNVGVISNRFPMHPSWLVPAVVGALPGCWNTLSFGSQDGCWASQM